MEEQDLKSLWKNLSEQLQTNLHFNETLVQERKVNQAQKMLNRLANFRIFEAVLFLVCLVLLVIFIGNHFPKVHFMIAGMVLAIFAGIGFFGNVVQITLIREMDYALPITEFQEKLEKLKTYNLRVFKLILLSIPFYLAYIIIGFEVLLGFDIYTHGNVAWWWSNVALSGLFLVLVLWLNKNLHYQSEKKWVHKLIEENGGRQIHAAMTFLKDIEMFKKEI